jgi:predicted Ser/Thr protein kinase
VNTENRQCLGRYTLLDRIATAGSTELWRGEQLSLSRPVVVKVLEKARPDLVERFQKEAQLLSCFDHPGIVRVLDFGAEDGRLFLVRDHVEGRPLEEVLRERTKVPAREAIALLIQIVEALECAHKMGVVHQGLTPSSILISEDGRARITDFGLAWWLHPSDVPSAPADLYALGGIAFRMLSGQRPLEGQDREGAPKRLEEVLELAPGTKRLAQVVDRMIEKDPAQRYASAKLVLVALRQAAEVLARADESEQQTIQIDPVAPPDVALSKSLSLSTTNLPFVDTRDVVELGIDPQAIPCDDPGPDSTIEQDAVRTDFELYALRAKALLRQGFELGRERFQAASRRDRITALASAGAFALLLLVFAFRGGGSAEATKAVEIDPVAQAREWLTGGHPKRAMHLLETELAKKGEQAPADLLATLGAAAADSGERSRAVTYFATAAAQDPNAITDPDLPRIAGLLSMPKKEGKAVATVLKEIGPRASIAVKTVEQDKSQDKATRKRATEILDGYKTGRSKPNS